MQNKNWLLGFIIMLIIVGVFAVWDFKKTHQLPNISQIAGEIESAYFSETASVMYFYSDGCHWCIEQKKDLEKLAPEGYRVKPMDVGQDQTLWETYKINGTPTFIAENGDRLEGYQTEDKLKPWLDEHK